ncbi:MAG: hypothetical protein K9N09_06655 [Candidatus Cloacimonetes bacterium]|nr:hypothetical protein [Candidatus Cloacimonadota bacterium]MCF7815037.1 hypothetical protein [Candidatus Cloacimonadota bacterium]MCF7868363.1 hypothetical protein [Candidatus Cloacimonadota bacterium]MCF7883871.1 hypothetical protein [Candidatus Cloacimonadota bacterium]
MEKLTRIPRKIFLFNNQQREAIISSITINQVYIFQIFWEMCGKVDGRNKNRLPDFSSLKKL